MTKICNSCQVEKPLEEFSKRARNQDGHLNTCLACKRDYNNKYYKNHEATRRKQIGDSTADQRAVRRALLNKFKDAPCTDCKGRFPPYCLDFDHITGEKVGNISEMYASSIETLGTELAKCELVCANCHRIRTHNRRIASIAQ